MMDHKAFLFDFDAFQEELRPVLETALATGNATELIGFIAANLNELSRPDEDEPLSAESDKGIRGQVSAIVDYLSATNRQPGKLSEKPH